MFNIPNNSSKLSDIMKQNDIIGTVQNVTFNDDGSVQKIEHVKTGTSDIVRTDAFTYDTDLVIEVRTVTAGGTLTYKYHTDTKQTEVI